MLTLHDYLGSGDSYPLDTVDDFKIVHKLNGIDILSFRISTKDQMYKLIKEENGIDYGTNSYLIKKIQDGNIECHVNMDFLKVRAYRNHVITTLPLGQVMQDHLPAGWIIVDSNVSDINRSMSFDFATDFDVLMESQNVYSVFFVWDLLLQKVTVRKPDTVSASGEYLTDELNLRNLSFQGESTELVTRLYAYGAEGMTFADINDGKPYVDDFSYSNKIICGYWADERYTVKASLLEHANKLLHAHSAPLRSYECDVVDLAKLDERYSFLDFKLHKKVTLIEGERGIRTEHSIVEYTEFPDDPSKNVVTLSTVPQTFQEGVQSAQTGIANEIGEQVFNLNQAILNATNLITGATGGHVLILGGEILIMDTEDIDTAENVWRWNYLGLGHSNNGYDGDFTLAMTMDGSIVASFITSGVLRGDLIAGGSVTAEKLSQAFLSDLSNGMNEITQNFIAGDGYVLSEITSLESRINGTLETYALTSTVEQTAEGLRAEFSEKFSGGVNKIYNSAALNGKSTDWEYNGEVFTIREGEAHGMTSSGSAFVLGDDGEMAQNVEGLIVGSAYTLTVKVYKDNTARAYIKLVYGTNEVFLFDTTSSMMWTELSVTIPSVDAPAILLEIFTTSATMYVSDIMFAEGDTKRGWTPAPDEIFTEVVKIDRNGISVANAKNQTQTVINSEEFAVLYEGDTVITVNKDETRLKKSIVDADLTIGKLKFLPLPTYSMGLNVILLD